MLFNEIAEAQLRGFLSVLHDISQQQLSRRVEQRKTFIVNQVLSSVSIQNVNPSSNYSTHMIQHGCRGSASQQHPHQLLSAGTAAAAAVMLLLLLLLSNHMQSCLTGLHVRIPSGHTAGQLVSHSVIHQSSSSHLILNIYIHSFILQKQLSHALEPIYHRQVQCCATLYTRVRIHHIHFIPMSHKTQDI